MDPARLTNVEDARRAAARTVPRALFDYVDGGADDELTMAQNVAAFRGIGLVPRMGLGRVAPRLSVELFGTTLDFPVLLA
ncbi:MAG: alpha-hydroxy-acid oxidizing protein, partial [Actinomycetota bacterium]|nr:alpha-hydroxy-acid oxidizing protein [Actinomycetota bacterium]